MPTGTWTVVIRKRPEQVFTYLADMRRHGEWSPKPFSIEPLSDGPIGVGSKYRSVGWVPRDPNHANDVEITAHEPPRHFAFTAYDRGQEFTSDFTLTPQDGGSRVVRVTKMPSPPGFAGVVFPVFFSLFVKPAIQKGMNMLKDKAEAQAS
jgi:uncharacterized protein YndB with AHSA1/START domain